MIRKAETNESFESKDSVKAVSMGIALAADSDPDEGPMFALTMGTEVGGRVYFPMDALEAVEYATEILRVVTEAMRAATEDPE